MKQQQMKNKLKPKKKISFRKFVDDNDAVYYENMETGEVVWDMPEDGELGL